LRQKKDLFFGTDALKVFKNIVLSCTSEEVVLHALTPFFLLKGVVKLEQTYAYIPTGSETIYCYKYDSDNDEITVEDVLLAFSGVAHYNKMESIRVFKIENSAQCDIWVQLFPKEDYMISHLVKPITFPYKNGRCPGLKIAKYAKDGIEINFWGLEELIDLDSEQIQFCHFGLIVAQTADMKLVEKIIASQTKYFSDNIERQEEDFSNIKNIFYNNLKLRDIYQKNIKFYELLKLK